MRITYVGHSTLLIEAGGVRLLTDPILRSRVGHLRRISPLPPLEPLLEPDIVLVSHAHFDHLDVPSLRLLRSRTVVVPRGCAGPARRAGLRQVLEVAPGQPVPAGAAGVRAVKLRHDGRRHPLSKARDTIGYVIEAEGVRAFFAGDTALFDEMGELDSPDVALLPVWGWGRRVAAAHHMGPTAAAQAAAMMRARIAIPIHWGTLAEPGVPWRADPARPAREFEQAVAELAPEIEVRVLEPGGSTEVLPASPAKAR